MAETDRTYVIAFRSSRPVAVPKARARPEEYPRARRSPIERLWRLIGWMLVGLLPAGLGALILAPLALPRAAAILTDRRAAPGDLRSAWLALVASGLIGAAGAVLSLVFLLHVTA